MNQAPAVMDNMTLLQRQMEVAGSLREKIRTPEELAHIRTTMLQLNQFFSQISRLATQLQLPLESVFQCLMQIGMGDAVSFDKQCRQGNVPMHQAKVLDRNASLNALKTEPRLREAVPAAKLDTLVQQCQTLRQLCRMKVEDGNDLSMARKMVALASEYLEYIHTATNEDPKRMWAAYIAEDEAQLVAALKGSNGSSKGKGDSTGEEGEIPVEAEKALPTDFVKAITQECHPTLLSNKNPFGERSMALATILSWLERCPEDTIAHDSTFHAIVNALHEPLKIHLAEKRSVLCRTACNILSVLCLRSTPTKLTSGKTRDILASWLTLLLGQVHVTVSAISEASDSVVRDVIISSQAPGFLTHAIVSCLMKATQPTLRRKCLGFLCIAAVAGANFASTEQASLYADVVRKFVSSGDDGSRRLSRVLGLILEIHYPQPTPLWDSKIEKLAESERPLVHEAAHSVEMLEVTVLGYEIPSGASLVVEEKLQIPRALSTLKMSNSLGSSGKNSNAPLGSGRTHTEKLPTLLHKPESEPTESIPSQRTISHPSKSSATTAPTPLSTQQASRTNMTESKKVNLTRPESISTHSVSVPPLKPVQEPLVQNPPPRVSTPGIPISLRSFSQEQVPDTPPKLSASLKARRASKGIV
jgi:hypothetical protein